MELSISALSVGAIDFSFAYLVHESQWVGDVVTYEMQDWALGRDPVVGERGTDFEVRVYSDLCDPIARRLWRRPAATHEL